MFGLGALLVAVLGLPLLISSGASGLSAEAARIACDLAPVLSLTVPFGVAAAVYATWTMSEGKHLNTLSEGIPAVGIVLTVLAIGSTVAWAWGTVAGGAVQVVFLWLVLGERGRICPQFRLRSPQWGSFARGFAVVLAAQFFMSLTTVVDQFFATRMGDGVVSILGYANRVLSLGLAVGATAVTRATLPVFSGISADDKRSSAADDLVRRWTLWTFLASVLAASAGFALAPWMVAVLFERGEFTASHTDQVAALLRYGMLQVPFYTAALVLVSSSASRGRYGVLLVTGVVGLTVKILANFALVNVLSVNALMVSTALVQAVNACILWWARRESNG